jgi:hypothetical protein
LFRWNVIVCNAVEVFFDIEGEAIQSAHFDSASTDASRTGDERSRSHRPAYSASDHHSNELFRPPFKQTDGVVARFCTGRSAPADREIVSIEVSPSMRRRTNQRALQLVDTTMPFATNWHMAHAALFKRPPCALHRRQPNCWPPVSVPSSNKATTGTTTDTPLPCTGGFGLSEKHCGAARARRCVRGHSHVCHRCGGNAMKGGWWHWRRRGTMPQRARHSSAPAACCRWDCHGVLEACQAYELRGIQINTSGATSRRSIFDTFFLNPPLPATTVRG